MSRANDNRARPTYHDVGRPSNTYLCVANAWSIALRAAAAHTRHAGSARNTVSASLDHGTATCLSPHAVVVDHRSVCGGL